MRDTYTPTFQTKGERDEVREILPKGNNSHFCQTVKTLFSQRIIDFCLNNQPR